MEVLHVSPVFGARSRFGGMATSTEYLCSELAKLGVKITVITTAATEPFRPDGKSQPTEDDKGLFPTIRLPVAARTFEEFTGIYYTPGFLGAYKRQAAASDVVHFHGFRSYQNFAAAGATKRLGKKYVLQPHGSAVQGYGKRFFKIVYDQVVGIRQATNASAVIASAQNEARQLKNLGINPARIHTIPHGVYREAWRRGQDNLRSFRDSFRISPNAPIVLFVGRLDSTKGLDLLIASFRTVLEETPAAILVLLGPDFGMQSRLESLVRNSGLVDHVIFAGPVGKDSVSSAYKESTLVVIPSAYESFSLVALEAAAAGTPVVMTEACGLAATFRGAGLIVAEPSIHSLAGAISRLVRDEEFRLLQRRLLDRLPWEKFSWREVARAVLGIYEEVLSS